jgi:TusA-related sulfurtransferase
MRDHEVDARGLSCPEPVLMTRRALEAAGSGTLEVFVDTETAVQGVSRLARSLGWKVSVARREADYCLTLERAASHG